MYHPSPRPFARIRVGVLQLRPPGDGYSRQMSFMMAHMLSDGLRAPPLDSLIFATFTTADCGNFHPPRTHTVIHSLPSFVYSSFRQILSNDFIYAYSTHASTTRRVVAARVALSALESRNHRHRQRPRCFPRLAPPSPDDGRQISLERFETVVSEGLTEPGSIPPRVGQSMRGCIVSKAKATVCGVLFDYGYGL